MSEWPISMMWDLLRIVGIVFFLWVAITIFHWAFADLAIWRRLRAYGRPWWTVANCSCKACQARKAR